MTTVIESKLVPPTATTVPLHDHYAFPTRHWGLDPELTFLNHGSYGSVPRSVLEVQASIKARMERDPVRFFKVDLERMLDEVRERIGAFVRCPPTAIAPMPNATIALCTILNNIDFKTGDEILITDHEYSSILNELERVCARTGAKVVKAAVPFPIESPRQVLDAVMACVTPRTKLAMIAHITSASSLIFPVTEIVRGLQSRGVEVCIDGAHTPGQVPIDIAGLNPTYYVGSFHKWLCAPKGSAFLYVKPSKQPGFRPLALSSRAHKIRPERSLYLRDFDYMGTNDYTAILSVPAAIDAVAAMHAGGWAGVMRTNHDLIIKARDVVARALGTTAPPHAAPDHMLGSMATLLLPEPDDAGRATEYDDALQDELINRHKIVAPIWRLNDDRRVVRISAQMYNTPGQYEKLGGALVEELARERKRRVSA